jgi:inward rectifier potassium channel
VCSSDLSAEGIRIRRLYDLRLLRDTNPIFALSWQVFHPIDAESPLHGCSPEDLARDEAMLIVVVTGTDDTMVATVHARSIYAYDQIVYNHHFVDVITPREGGGVRVDYTRFHLTTPAPEGQRVPGMAVSPAPTLRPPGDDD